MKVLSLFLIIGNIAFSQECISERWISVKVTPEIRLKLKENGDLISFIKSRVLKNELTISQIEINAYDEDFKTDIKPINYIYNSHYELIDSIALVDYFNLLEPSSIPLVNENGDPVTRKNESGALEYVYPAPEVLELNVDLLSEIRIKEIKAERQSKTEFIPVEIGFYTSSLYMSNEPFWIDINELYEAEKDKTVISGHDFFLTKQYEGFQYKQKQCSK